MFFNNILYLPIVLPNYIKVERLDPVLPKVVTFSAPASRIKASSHGFSVPITRTCLPFMFIRRVM